MLRSSRRQFLSTAGVAAGALLLPRVSSFAQDKAVASGDWQPLFDGKSLAGWKVTDFSGGGEVTVSEGRIVLEAGNDLTGITYTGEYPKMNYELRLEAMRVAGSDFFCGLTFPYAETNLTFVAGGWGGGVTGISSINGDDASENETTQILKYELNRWYKIRLRVTPNRIETWIDNESTASVNTDEKRLGMRPGEIELSAPLGIASFRTRSAVRGIEIQRLKA